MSGDGFWRWFDRGARVDFGGTLLGFVFDWKGWIATAVGGGGGVVTFLKAAIDGKSPLDVWVFAVIVAACLVVIVYLSISLLEKYRKSNSRDNSNRESAPSQRPMEAVVAAAPQKEKWPDFKIWDQKEKFELYEAACLWFNIDPVLPMPEQARSKYQTWKDMVFGGGLPIDLKNTIQIIHLEKKKESAVTPHDLIDRGVLETLAEHEGHQPLFLYPHKRGEK